VHREIAKVGKVQGYSWEGRHPFLNGIGNFFEEFLLWVNFYPPIMTVKTEIASYRDTYPPEKSALYPQVDN